MANPDRCPVFAHVSYMVRFVKPMVPAPDDFRHCAHPCGDVIAPSRCPARRVRAGIPGSCSLPIASAASWLVQLDRLYLPAPGAGRHEVPRLPAICSADACRLIASRDLAWCHNRSILTLQTRLRFPRVCRRRNPASECLLSGLEPTALEAEAADPVPAWDRIADSGEIVERSHPRRRAAFQNVFPNRFPETVG